MILQRTDGNPFFIEEVIRALLESGALLQREDGLHWNPDQSAERFTVPGNVQALLAARIDRLEREARSTLQLASVIGSSTARVVLESTLTGRDMQIEDVVDFRLNWRRKLALLERRPIETL